MTTAGPRILCFGEMLLRLSAPGATALFQTASLDARFGGAETNVAIGLARLGADVAVASIVPDDAIGRAALEHARAAGVDVSRVARRPGRMGLWFLSPGIGQRGGFVIYDRAGSAFALAGESDFDWPALLDGFGWLHLSGITPALGPRSAAVALAAVKAAKAAGLRVSFDGNYRERLWAAWDSDPAAILRELVAHTDLFFGNARDIALLLGTPVATDPRAAALAAFDAFADLRWIAATERTVLEADNHRLSARLDRREGATVLEAAGVSGIVDRIGGGDAFAAGVLSAIDTDEDDARRRVLALAVLKHYFPGDASFATPEDVAAFHQAGRDVRR